MKRQALTVSISELRELANKLEEEAKQTSPFISNELITNGEFLVPIINKTGMSDDWKIEPFENDVEDAKDGLKLLLKKERQ